MTAIPARVAGVREIVLVTPPGRDGRGDRGRAGRGADRRRHRGLADRRRAGGRRARLRHRRPSAASTRSSGPGNIYVALAKARVFGEVGIDMVAGPSEVVVIADAPPIPRWIAADLLAQAEHDPMARALLITDARRAGAARRRRRSTRQLERAAAPGDRRRSRCAANGALILVADLDAAVDARQPPRARAPRADGRACRRRCCRACGTPARSSWARTRPRWWATTWPDPTTCCRPPARRASRRRWRPRTS